MSDQIENSFLKGGKVELECTVDSRILIKGYKKLLDIGYLFKKDREISLYKCVTSSFRFFYPFRVAGDSHFYEVLQTNDWYYMPWKWEHQKCLNYIKDGYKILDVGSGQGDFLKKVGAENKTISCVGLELN